MAWIHHPNGTVEPLKEEIQIQRELHQPFSISSERDSEIKRELEEKRQKLHMFIAFLEKEGVIRSHKRTQAALKAERARFEFERQAALREWRRPYIQQLNEQMQREEQEQIREWQQTGLSQTEMDVQLIVWRNKQNEARSRKVKKDLPAKLCPINVPEIKLPPSCNDTLYSMHVMQISFQPKTADKPTIIRFTCPAKHHLECGVEDYSFVLAINDYFKGLNRSHDWDFYCRKCNAPKVQSASHPHPSQQGLKKRKKAKVNNQKTRADKVLCPQCRSLVNGKHFKEHMVIAHEKVAFDDKNLEYERDPYPDRAERKLDYTRPYAHAYREQGRYGSHPSHDGFDDDSNP
ncbi:MAG TPA: hypothetical protein VFD58_33680 [Blastocatellia bacterium]|nr:hypothetical protein [Blastocatellia bacterium]